MFDPTSRRTPSVHTGYVGPLFTKTEEEGKETEDGSDCRGKETRERTEGDKG